MRLKKKLKITVLDAKKCYEEASTEWINTRQLGERCHLDKVVKEDASEKLTFVWGPEWQEGVIQWTGSKVFQKESDRPSKYSIEED